MRGKTMGLVLAWIGGLLAGAWAAAAGQPGPEAARAAVERALPLLEKSSAEYTRKQSCFACHHQTLPVLAIAQARSRGFRVDEGNFESQAKFTEASLRAGRDGYRQGRGQGGGVDTAGYALWGLETAGWKPDETTAAVAEFLLVRDREADTWRPSANRPPHEASKFTATFLALRSLQVFATAEQKERAAARREKARQWLLATAPRDTEDRVFRLWALKYAGADSGEIQGAALQLRETQRPDGGWAQREGMESDAYATGTALVVLHQAGGMPASDPAYQRGVKFLLATQREDGTWLVRTRSQPIQTYFETGFPHGKDQFISIAATSWATTALALACPPNINIMSSPTMAAQGEAAELILRGGKIVTVDRGFSVHAAMAVRGGRIVRVGSEEQVLPLRGPRTEVMDLGGKMVLPGLIDSHVHPNAACMTEFDHAIPEMETVAQVLEYVRGRARALQEGQWIQVRQVFITRLREQRYPTRAELDEAAPRNPVIFSTGPDASLNSLALQASGIDRNFKVTDGGPGHAEKDAQTGEPTGILRSCTRYVKVQSPGRQATEADRERRLLELFRDYNAVGITGIGDRDASAGEIDRYRRLRERNALTLRVVASQHIDTIGPLEEIRTKIRKVAEDPLCRPDPFLRIVGVKTYLDGGMLTGSAYMRQPWGVSKIYAIADPAYRGVLFIPKERLVPMVEAAVEAGIQFTAHSVGDGAVHALLEAYEEVNRKTPVRKTRPCITHSNFMSREAVETAARLGVAVDIQPAWLYLDTRTLVAQFGKERLRYFQPLRSLFEAGAVAGGGSDHMQKIGSFRSINPYNPFLGMQTAITRRAKGFDGALHPEEALTREQALRFYTGNNAHLTFREDQVGSLEPGKLADFIVIDTDLLTCPVDQIRNTQVLRTYVGGKVVFKQEERGSKDAGGTG